MISHYFFLRDILIQKSRAAFYVLNVVANRLSKHKVDCNEIEVLLKA